MEYLILKTGTNYLPLGVTPAGTIYYTAPGGNDSNLGTIGSPFLTVAKGLSVLTPGDLLYLRAGTYAEVIDDTVHTGTSWALPVTIAGYPGEQAILQPGAGASHGMSLTNSKAYIEVRDLVFDGTNAAGITNPDAIKIAYSGSNTACHHIRINRCEVRNWRGNGILITQDPSLNNLVSNNEILSCSIHDNGIPLAGGSPGEGHGIYIESSDNLVQGCTIRANGEYGVHLYRSAGTSPLDTSRNVVAANLIADNGFGFHSGGGLANGWGVLCSGKANLIYNNLVYGNKGGGIQGTWNNVTNGTDAEIYFNSVYGNNLVGGNHGIEVDSHTSGFIVKDNASHGNTADFSVSTSSAGSTEDYNVYGTRSGIAQGAHSLVADPNWTSPTTGDFTISGSPCRGAGLTIAQVPRDYAGTTRANPPSIGAYE